MARIIDLPDAPKWLLDAKTKGEDVEMSWGGNVVWYGGTWYDGIWCGGVWYGGTWHDGMWYDGAWHDGAWYGGTWRGGSWYRGLWEGGTWEDPRIKNRILYMAHLAGVTFFRDSAGELWGTCARSTGNNGKGLYRREHKEEPGSFVEERCKGDDVCTPGKHGGAHSVNYHGYSSGRELWAMTFRAKDLMGCDGEKIKVRAGFTHRVGKNPWESEADGDV